MKLFTKMTLTILVPAILGLATLGIVGYRSASDALHTQIEEDAPIILASQEIGLDVLFRTLQHGMEMPARNIRTRELLLAYSQGRRDAELIKGVDALLARYVEVTGSIATCGLVAPDGTMLASRSNASDKPGKLVGTNVGERAYVQAALQGRSSIGTYPSRETGKLSTIVGIPVKIDGLILGVFFAGLDNEVMSHDMLGDMSLSTHGSAFVYNPQGEVILHSDVSQLGRKDGGSVQFQMMQGKRQGRLEVTGADGREKIVYFRFMPNENWYYCFSLDKDVTFAKVFTLRNVVTILVLVLGIMVSCIIFVVARGITRALGVCSVVVDNAAQGNFDVSASEDRGLAGAERRGDEISVVAGGVRKMIAGIRRLLRESEAKTEQAVQATEAAKAATARAEDAARRAELARRDGMQAAADQLGDVVSVITTASDALNKQITHSDRTAADSAERLSEAATAMNEMNATVQEVARNASDASKMSAQTRQKAEEGAKVVQDALSSIEKVQAVATVLREDMQQLSEHARSINTVMGVISDIADQTNLLALNAAIEAARAGEAGRGFAVVADEVRKLAEKTMASTSEVGNAINAIQQSTAKSVEGVDRAVEQIANATELATRSGEALTQIVSDAEITADEVRAIATASEQQSAASEEINQSIVQVNSMSAETAQSMAEAAQAVADLSAQTSRLHDLMAQMKNQ